jgi:hypothetical protein
VDQKLDKMDQDAQRRHQESLKSHAEGRGQSTLQHEKTQTLQIEAINQSKKAAAQIKDQFAFAAAQQAKTLDIALSQIIANASAGGAVAIIKYSEGQKARLVASKAEQELARYKSTFPNLNDYNRFVQVIHDSSFRLVGKQSPDRFFD